MIYKHTPIDDVVKTYPETVAIFERHGLGCIGCRAALFENIEQGAEIHGIDVNTLVEDLNRAAEKD